jgi:hypothetical protein
MRLKDRFKKIGVFAFALVLAGSTLGYARGGGSESNAFEYKYKVHNKSKNTITKLLASEDGKNYGEFEIGDGIEPGKTVTLVWDKSTDNGNCDQWIKAVFDDGESSPAQKFDFCEEDLVLEFS